MDNLSHSRHRSSSKVITNGGGGFLAKTLYDDVYGGPPKFGLSSTSSSLSPRLEDYGEIFGAFHASRASSIPVLELPVSAADGDNEEFFDVRSSGFDYSEVFGGLDGLDFAVAYDDLVNQNNGGDGGSSDEAWTPAGSASLSGESNHSGKNQSFSDGDPYYSFEGGSEFGISYTKAHKKSNKESLNGRTDVNPVPAASGYRYVPDEITPVQKTKFDGQSLQVTDDRKFNVYTKVEMGNEKHLRNTVSLPPNGSSAGQTYAESHKPERGYGRNGSHHKEPFVTISDISLRTQPSHLPPPCRPPPVVDGNSEDSGRLSSNSNTVSSDERAGDSSPPFFDVEVDASSSAAVSAAAMKEAMEKARVQLRSAKELLQKRKEGHHSHSKYRSKKEIKEVEGKAGKVADGSSSKKDDRARGTSGGEDSRTKFSVSEETQKVLKKVREDRESLRDGTFSEAAKDLEQEKGEKGSWSSQGSFKIDEASEWQEATRYFDLVALDDTKKAFEQANKDNILFQSTKGHEHRQTDKGTVDVLEQQCRGVEECNARLKDGKESQRQKEKVKVTQETFDKGESEMSSKVGKLPAGSEKQRCRSAKSEKKDNMAEVQGKENNFNIENAMHQDNNEVELQEKAIRTEERHKESRGREGIQSRQETLEQEENERRLLEAFEQAENEVRLKELLGKKENEKSLKEALEQAENERRLKKALEWQENERRLEALERENSKRQKEAAQREENEKRLKEVREKEENEKRLKEENEKRLKKALELQENEKKVKEAHERENKRRQKEAAQREENEKRLKEALELEEYQKRLKDAREREETERRLKMAHAREQQYAMERLQESQEKAFKQAEMQQQLDEANISVESEQNTEVADDRNKVEVLNITQKGTERNELRSVEGTYLRKEVEDHKVSDETFNQDHDENSQASQMARNHDENSETMKKSQEVHAHEGNGEKKIDKTNNNAQSDSEIVKPVNVSLDLEYKVSALSPEDFKNGEKWFRIKDANESLSSDASVKTAREEIRAQSQIRKKEMGEAEMRNGRVDEKFKASSLAQGGTESGNSQARMDDAYESIPFVEFVKKAVEASSGIEVPQPQSSSTSWKDSVQGTQKMDCAQEWKEREKDSKQVHASSNQEENLAPEPVKEFVDNRRGTQAAHPVMAEIPAINNRKSSQQANASQAPERNAKNLKEETLNGEKETERLERERELENDRLRKIEEEREREREREKDRMAVDRATLEARNWAYVEGREKTERVAVERATADARQRAMAEARERLEKACAEAREKSLAGKAAMEARLKAERAAVERATAEARERAAERLMAERASFEARERVQRSVSDKFNASSRSNGLRHCLSSSDLQDPQKARDPYATAYSERYGVEGESAQRCKARLERHARTAERAAKALAEKNTRDLLAQREQAERNRLADTLDADVKRWSSGKEGNLRALLSTLQYILGPDSGWQPVPLTEVITAAAAKKAYRKATLCVHPDKLQQRGASIHQKYICEKVFDLLKEAWNKFNSEER